MRKNMEFTLFVISFLVFIFAIITLFAEEANYELFGMIKPITIIQYSGFLAWAFLLNLVKNSFLKLNERTLNIFIIIAFFMVMGSLFEVFWAFGYWFTSYELQVISGAPNDARTLDATVYKPSNDLERIYYLRDDHLSLNKSAKKNILYFMMSVYLVYFLNDIKRDILKK